MRRTGWGLLAVLVVLATVLIWRAWPEAEERAVRLHGHVDIRQVALAFEGSERVSQMLVEEGKAVRAGQLLAMLDTRLLQLQREEAEARGDALAQRLLALQQGSRPEEIAQAAAQVERARAEARQAWQRFRRLQQVAENSRLRAVSRQDLDNARAQAEAAQASLDAMRQAYRLARAGTRREQVAQAEAELKAARAGTALLQHRIDQGHLLAPVDAVVRARLLEPGDMASPQRPAYTLALTSPKWVRVYADAMQLSRLRLDMPARVLADDGTGQALPGRIAFISSVAEFTPKTVQTEALRADLVYEVRIRVDDEADRLKLGMPVTAILDAAGLQGEQETEKPDAPALATPARPDVARTAPASQSTTPVDAQ